MILINGHREHSLSVADRGLQYGDGLFETLAVQQGQPVYLHEHLRRLKQGCERLLIPCPELDLLSTEARQLAQHSVRAVLKIIVTRGSGGRGYRQPDSVTPTRILSLHPFPDYPLYFKQQGVALRFCQTRLGLNPCLAGIKHLNRLEQVMARSEWQNAAVQEGLMLDSAGRVIEGTMSNLFFVKDRVLYTPPLTHCGVAGIIREKIIQLAVDKHFPFKQQHIKQKALLAVDELFVTNSIIGIWPVRALQQKTFPVGEMTQTLMANLEQPV
jgi:4-amino-4-deoxychorismate lyase